MIPNDKSDFIYDILKRRHDAEIERRKELDSKASNLINYTSIVTGITIGLGTTFQDALLTIPLFVSFFVGITFLLISIITALVGSRVMTWHEAPDIEKLFQNCNKIPPTKERMQEDSIFHLYNAIEKNFKKNQSKANYVAASGYLMISGLMMLAIFLAILVITSDSSPNLNF